MARQHTLNVGILGSGNIARQHANGWSQYPVKASIAAFADIAIDRAQAMSETYTDGEAATYASLDEMLGDERIDVVDICLPHHLHTDAIIAAAKAGKAILCEKPLCTNLEDARRIQQALEESGVIFMSAHNQLFQPSLIEARRLIATGAIGTPFLFRSIESFQNRAFNPHSRTPVSAGDLAGWRADLKQSGGGELLDTGYHGTYRLLALANNDRPIEVTGFLSRFLMTHLPTEDTGQVVVRFASGAVGTILTSWALDVVGGTQFEVSGEHGALAGSASELRHQVYRWPEPSKLETPVISSFTAEIGHFIEVVRSGADNPASFDLAARVLQVIKGAYLSAQLGQTVSLPEDPTGDPVAGTSGVATPFSVTVPDEVLA
ncbi:MAG TPA: Gfo/Idh/MocA family oxidoreductase [Thermomicrobiales bacterium]|nr:Gfo/Idh/MocA family oxidoreductase [Thermomicrobiales bacterium]